MTFQAYLKQHGISPATYLKLAHHRARAAGHYDPAKLHFATDSTHKLKYDGVAFGAAGYKDFILYTLLDGHAVANAKRSNYRKRAVDVMRATHSPYSAASLAYNILW